MQDFPFDDIGGVLISLSCLALIAIGKESATVNSVLFMAVGFMFGKHTRKTRR